MCLIGCYKDAQASQTPPGEAMQPTLLPIFLLSAGVVMHNMTSFICESDVAQDGSSSLAEQCGQRREQMGVGVDLGWSASDVSRNNVTKQLCR